MTANRSVCGLAERAGPPSIPPIASEPTSVNIAYAAALPSTPGTPTLRCADSTATGTTAITTAGNGPANVMAIARPTGAREPAIWRGNHTAPNSAKVVNMATATNRPAGRHWAPVEVGAAIRRHAATTAPLI